MTDTPTARLAELDREHERARDARRAIDRAERESHEAVHAAAAVQELIRRRLGREDVDKPLVSAQRKLDRAREQAKREWPLERAAGDALVRDRAGAVERFLVQHSEALLAEEQERAAPLAREMDDLAARVVELRQDLAASERRTMRIVHTAHRGREQAVSQLRSDAFAQTAATLLQGGVEQVPRYVPPATARDLEPLVKVHDEPPAMSHRERTTRPAEEVVS
jgi:hypothetical protein